MDNSIDVSIIIINYKNYKMTNDAVNSVIENSSNFNYEILIVDNSNDEDEFINLSNIIGNKAKCINANSNLGFGKGNNLGVKHSKGKYVYFLNNDTLLVNNAIYELFLFLENNKEVGIVGSNLYTKSLNPNFSYSKKEYNYKFLKKSCSLFNQIQKKLLKKSFDFNESDKPLKIFGFVAGASLMMSRLNFDQLDGFDKDIFMYGEDVLICYQLIHKLKLDIYNVPTSKIIHLEKKGHISKVSANNSVTGTSIYFKKVYGLNEWKKICKMYVKNFKFKIRIGKFIHLNLDYESMYNWLNRYKDELSL